MRYSVLLVILLLVLFICACPAPKEDYVIVNQSSDLLNVNYKVRNCAENPNWSKWIPMINSYEEYVAASEWMTSISKDKYSVLITAEEINTSHPNDVKIICKIANYSVPLPENSALRISYGDFHTPNQITYLKLEGNRGTVIFEGTNLSIKDLFKPYQPRFFKKTQNTISY